MLKKLSGEGLFEADIETRMKGKVWAFVPVIIPNTSFVRLGIATANEPGYSPLPTTWCLSDSWPEMFDHASELNRAMGVSDEAAARIVCSSLRPIHPIEPQTARK